MAPPGETPSNNLWVGNLAPDATDADLTSLFQKYGPLDSVTTYSSRGFGFLYFKNINDAKEAKDALQGSFFHGNPLRIEFAKPAKPCKSLWVAGISKSVSKEELEDQFKGFGKIQEYKFIRDRNTAYIDFARLEDAAEALKNMNGKKFGGEQIRVDYLRSQPTRREQGPEVREMRDGQYPNRSIGHPDTRHMPQDLVRNYSDPMHSGFIRQHPFMPVGQRDGQPSKVLCISYPPSVHVDEDMLHNAMILFGEIDGIKTFYDRNFSLVEFRSVEEAQRAKEGLQGKLFNDPRITIEYSSSGPAPGRDFLEYHPPIIGPTTDFYPNDNPFQPAQMGMFGHNRPMLASNVPGRLPPYGIHGPDIPARPLGMQGRFDPVISGPEFTDLSVPRKLRDTSPHNVMGGPNWKQASPTPGMLSSPSGEQRPPSRSAVPGWDAFDSSQLQRETKRSRVDGAFPHESSYPHKRIDDRGAVLDEQYGLGPFGSNVPSGPVTVSQASNSVLDARIAPGQRHSGHNYIWRGIIAKGGTPVCHARCLQMGERIESEIPDVVNCSARTGLDMLTKHYADAVGFNIVYFLPDSEEDFVSYTEFLSYLGSKDRAGVAKFGDGTTMFLVPPSDFLTNVLKVVGPKRLYGVVLKFAHHIPSGTSLPPESNQPQYVDTQRITSSQAVYDVMPSVERVSQMNYNQVTREDLKLPSKEYGSLTDAYPTNPVQPSNTAAYPPNPVHQSISAAPTQAGVSLTPELIATLAKMLPASKLSSVEGTTVPAGASAGVPASDVAVAPGKVQQQSWRYEQQAPGQAADHLAQFGNQFNNQTQVLSQLQAHPQVLNTPNHYSQGPTSFSQMQEHNLNLQAQGGTPQTLTSTIISQGTQLSAQPHVDRQLQLGRHQDTVVGSGISHGRDALGHYGSSVPQQPTNFASLPNQTHGANVSQSQAGMPVASGTGLATQMQQLQSALYGSVQEGSESEVDKNERYQATLLFAANLLSKIHNQKPSSQSGQGPDNH